MKTAKLTWLLIATMIASLTLMPAPVRAEPKELRVTIEVERTEVPIPTGFTFPYIEIWKIWCMTDGIADWDIYGNVTRDQLAEATIPDDINEVTLKFFVNENLTGWFVNDFYYGDQTSLTIDYDCGVLSDGTPWVNSTEWGPTAADVYDNTSSFWWGPLIDWWGGLVVGGTEQASQMLTYTAIQALPMGRHTYFMSGFTKDCIDNGDGKLVEQWLSTTDYLPIYLHHAPDEEEEEDEPLSLVFGLLALIAISMISMIRRRK